MAICYQAMPQASPSRFRSSARAGGEFSAALAKARGDVSADDAKTELAVARHG
jgi:hypothetical protein